MESSVKSNGDKRRRPDSVTGEHKESATGTGETVSDKVGTESNENLVAEVGSERLVEVDWQVLREDDVLGVGSVETDVCHDCDQHVFLDDVRRVKYS